jgi:DNA-binding MarR family transcriptional regulator
LIKNLPFEKEYNLWILLNHTRHAIYRARESELIQYDITVEQARLLYVVNSLKDKAIPTEIARHLFRESHTISSLIDRMEQKYLVKRVKDLSNKRIVKIILTKKGLKALNETMVMGSIHRIISGLSEEQMTQLDSSLKTLMERASGQIVGPVKS